MNFNSSAYKTIVFLFVVMPLFCSYAFASENASAEINFTPIEHASFVMQTNTITIYVDPVGTIGRYGDFPAPDIILITDIHYDHLDSRVVGALKKETTTVIGPQQVIAQLGYGEAIAAGNIKTINDVSIEAVAAYNLTQDRLQFHERGRGVGYVVTMEGKRIYISGDTEDVPEMRNLKDIDYAFVCMNLPYTMSVEQAADAVLAFCPNVVFPYHFRGKENVSDIEHFRSLVEEKNQEIDVRVLSWYPHSVNK